MSYDELDTWVQTVYGQCRGYLEVDTRRPDGKGVTAGHMLVSEWETLAALQLSEQTDVYLGCCTVKEPPEGRKRGSFKDRFEMPGLWLDMDIGDLGHKPSADGLRHFEDEKEAVRILWECGFPAPTAIVWSGGGIYPWWLFDTPLVLEPDERRDNAQALSDKWHQHAYNTASARGIKVDKLGDLPRFLRPPGTINHKEGQRRPTRMLSFDIGARYSPNDLWTLVAGVDVYAPVKKAPGEWEGTGDPGSGVLADALKGCPWAAILEPAGWTFAGYRGGDRNDHEAWARPGKDPREGDNDSALAAPEVLTVFSDAAGLPSGRGARLTKLRVMAHLYFGGSEAAALSDLTAAAQHGLDDAVAPWPDCALEKARESVNMDLAFIQRRIEESTASLGPAGDLSMIGQTRRRTTVEDENGKRWVISRGSGFRG